MTSDNISRFPHSGQRRRSATSEACGWDDAEIAQRTRKFLADWQIAGAVAEIGTREETARMIAETRKRRGTLTFAACREDELRQTIKQAAE